jgi:formylglycine-generating enzyme required for sulfatase activity
MKIFLSYASQDRALVEPVRLALLAQGHNVFFDREDLPPGDEYDARIRRAIESSHLFIAFLSPDTFDRGSYTITEIEIAERTWVHPKGRVLPVVLRAVDFAQIPSYLKAITFLEPTGNVAASVADVVHSHGRERRLTLLKWSAAAAATLVVATLAYYFLARNPTNATRDGAPMVLVPGGEFQMGDGELDPLRHVHVDPFFIDVYEITTERFASFLTANGGIAPPDHWEDVKLERDRERPVIGVSWHDADGYCRWAGKRLPTDAEWEKAGRGTDSRKFPWGDAAATPAHANFLNEADAPYPNGLHPVGKHPKGQGSAGTFDQAGNASEWVADWYTDSFDRRNDSRNPKGPPSGDGKVLRGGGWHEGEQRMTVTARYHASPDTRADDLGFRCARDARQ